MRILLLTGSHPRHFYLVNKLASTGKVVGHVIEQREEFIPSPPDELNKQDKVNFIRHFEERAICEKKYFSGHENINSSINTYQVTNDTLNSEQTISWVLSQKPDLVISYGIHKLTSDFLNRLMCPAFNIHGGLSPWFKGNITLFWPFYLLKPNWAGMTIHVLSSRLDAGDILHHSVPELEYGDGIHDVSCKSVIQVSNDFYHIIEKIPLTEWTLVPQKGNGKLFTSTDWTPQHLRLIYNQFDNNIVDAYLNGELTKSSPNLVKAFECEE